MVKAHLVKRQIFQISYLVNVVVSGVLIVRVGTTDWSPILPRPGADVVSGTVAAAHQAAFLVRGRDTHFARVFVRNFWTTCYRKKIFISVLGGMM